MNSVLPVVVKAQPYREDDYDGHYLFSDWDEADLCDPKEVLRERLGWEEREKVLLALKESAEKEVEEWKRQLGNAGRELYVVNEREKALKQKIKEHALNLEICLKGIVVISEIQVRDGGNSDFVMGLGAGRKGLEITKELLLLARE